MSRCPLEFITNKNYNKYNKIATNINHKPHDNWTITGRPASKQWQTTK